MIQRKQSLWLLLAALMLVLMLILPIATIQVNGISVSIYTWGYTDWWDMGELMSIRIQYFIPLLFTNIVTTILCLVSIFNFRKRNLQKYIIIFTIVAIIGFTFLCNIYVRNMKDINFGIGACFPILAVLFCILAVIRIENRE